MGTVRFLSLTTLIAVAGAMSFALPTYADDDEGTGLTWTGENSNSWDTSTENWKSGEDATTWENDADATFNEEGEPDVAITEAITAGSVTVTGVEVSYTFTFDGGSLTAENLTIDEGASLTITETGTLTISGTLSNEGTLTLGDTSGSSGEMGPVSTPGTVTVDLTSAIENSGKIIIGDGVVFVLNESLLDGESGVYTFITNGEGGSVTGWGDLTTSNFELNGKILTGRSQLTLTADGQVSVEFVAAADLVWAGEEGSSAWNKTSENWTNSDVPDFFYDYDNVTFTEDASSQNVSIGEAIIAGSVEVASGTYTWSFERGGAVTADTFTIAAEASLTINNSGTLTVTGSFTNAGELTLNSTILDLGSAIENTGKVTVGSGVTLVLNESLITSPDDTNNGSGTYTFITNSGNGTIVGWDSDTLTKSNFMLDGSVISGRSTVDVSTAGQVTVEIVDAANLIWNGTSGNSAWNTENSTNWKNNGSDDYFYSQDNVTFNGSAASKDVTIGESVMAGRMTVSESSDYTFSISADGSVMASSLVINSGSSLTISGSGSLTISYSEDEQITVNGSLKIGEGTTTNLGGIVRIGNGSDNTGTIEITGGTTTFENSVMVGNNNNSSDTTSKITISDGIVIFEEQVNVGYVSYNATDGATASGSLEISGGKTTFDSYVCVGHTNTAGTTATGTIKISNGAEVTFYSLSVGYGAWNDSTGYGTAEITGGKVTVTDVTYIGRTGSDAATSYGSLTISGGDVTLGGATYIGRSITAGSEAYGALIITGGNTKITGDVYIGYVNTENATANGYVYISGGTVTFGEEGEESEKHTVFVGSDYADDDISNASFTISGEATVVTFYDEVDVGYARSTTTAGDNDDDSFTISGGTVTFNGNVYVGRARVEEGNTANGSFTITGGETTIHLANVGYADATNATATGTFTISGGKTTFENASTIAYSYTAGASTEASMTISGDGTEVYFKGDLFIGRAAAGGATAEGSLEISDGATVNFVGMQLGRTTSNGKSSYGELTIGTAGATNDLTKVTFSSYLYLGYNLSGSDTSSEGKATIYSGTVEFKSAQIGYSSAGGTGSGTIIIGSTDGGGAPNVTFSSTVYIGNATDTAGSATGTIEIHSGTTTFSSAVYVGNSTASTGSAKGTLTIDGGDTTFNGAFYVGYATGDGEATGSVDISGGKVAFNGNITVAGGSSSFSVGSGADVTIAKVTVDLASAISNSGTITLDDGVTFVLNDSLATTEDNTTTYTFITESGTIIVGTESAWNTLGYANFVTSSGMALDTVHTTINLETAGSLTITYSSADLIWTGNTSNVWVNDKDTLQNWKDKDNTSTYFINGDSVTFDSTADTGKRTVSIGEAIVAGTVTVDGAAYTWEFSEDGEGSVTADSLTLKGDGASLTITGNGEFDLGNTTSQSLFGEGSITVSDGATLKLVEGGDDKYEDENITITVGSGGTLDVDGDGGTMFKLVLNGGTLTSSINMTETKKQLPNITLTADSTVDATHSLGMIGSSYSETSLDLGNHTLTKTGDGNFFLHKTTVTAGTIDVTAGTLELYGTDASAAAITVETGATLVVGSANNNSYSKVGTLTGSGTVDLKAGSTLEITGNSTISGSLSLETTDNNHSTLKVTGGANLTLNVSSVLVGSGSTLSIGDSSSLTLNTSLAFHDSGGSVSGNVTFSTSASLIVSQSVFNGVEVNEDPLTAVAVAVITANTISFGDITLEYGSSESGYVTDLVSNYITVQSGDYRVTGWYYYAENGTLYACVIPEPSMFGLMFGFASVGLVATRRRRRKAA